MLVTVVGVGCAPPARLLSAPPSLLPHTTMAMKTPGFWIARHPYPDKVVLSPREIEAFNKEIQDNFRLTQNLSAWPQLLPAEKLRAGLSLMLDDLRRRDLVLLNGAKPDAAYWTSVEEALDLNTIPPAIARQYGLIVRYTDQRFLPVEKGLYSQAGDVDFDELQNSALDIGTPVVILHRSQDGRWLFVESSASSGWVDAQHVAAVTDEQIQSFWSAPFVVVTVPKADIYLNRDMTEFSGYAQMGVRLPLRYPHAAGDYVEVTVPRRQPDGTAVLALGFMAAAQVHQGYLSYTPRNILEQAFKMLNQPYGWGGMYGEQDCSRFLQQVFATVGIELPRDSKNQIQTGESLAAWPGVVSNPEKLQALKDSAVPGITLLGMKGHILLYIGSVDERAYAIHCVWAYRQSAGKSDDTFVLGRVIVSDLSLGEGSKKGSLLERLNVMRILTGK